MTTGDLLTPATVSRAQLLQRFLAALVIATLFSSFLVGTAAWFATWTDDQTLWTRLAVWMRSWSAYSVWTFVVALPAVLLGGALDRLAPPMRPVTARLVFAGLGLATGIVAALLLLSSLGTVALGVVIVGTIGAVTAYVTRRLLDPLAGARITLAVLTLATIALVTVGLLVY